MIYTAQPTSKNTKPTLPFSSRGIDGLTQGKPSELDLFAKPVTNQVAYAGYVKSIEAFLYATSHGKKVPTNLEDYPLNKARNITFPLPLPRLIVQLAGKPTHAFVESFKTKLGPYELEMVDTGKIPHVYTISKPTVKLIEEVLPKYCKANGPQVEGYVQLDSAKDNLALYRAIDVFLATHTYEYKGDFPTADARKRGAGVAGLQEFRYKQSYWRPGWNEEKVNSIKNKEVVEMRIDAAEEEDLNPDLTTMAYIDQVVHIAKPSPLPSSSCFGPPSAVPNKSGLFFPYFRGLLVPDTKALRVITSLLFFRNLGDEKLPSKEAYSKWRRSLGTFANSDAGLCIHHILIGIGLALDAQAICFLVFDESVYKGFCLLGTKFRVHAHGTWNEPLDAAALRDELSTVKSQVALLEDLRSAMEKCVDGDGDQMQIENLLVTNMPYIASMLAKIDTKESDDEKLKDVETLLGRCSFPTRFLPFNAASIVTAVQYLTTAATPWDQTLPIFIPIRRSDWSRLGDPIYHVLASFGPRSFSFVNAKGTRITIPAQLAAHDPMAGEKKVFIVYEKAVAESVKDWKKLLTTGQICIDFEERAGGNRGHKFPEAQWRQIWDALKTAAIAQKFDKTKDAVDKKRNRDEAFGVADMAGEMEDF